jgi:hypothetical protein
MEIVQGSSGCRHRCGMLRFHMSENFVHGLFWADQNRKSSLNDLIYG